VLLFQCLTGRLPFAGEEIGDVLVAICSDPVPRQSQIVPELGPEVDAFCAPLKNGIPDHGQHYRSCWVGGSETDAYEQLCESDQAVVRLDVNSGSYANQFRIWCQDAMTWRGTDNMFNYDSDVFGGSQRADKDAQLTCQQGTVSQGYSVQGINADQAEYLGSISSPPLCLTP
jgi:hypothetical protein